LLYAIDYFRVGQSKQLQAIVKLQANSLYYYFSTVAQVLAAISALLAVFTQFKISEIKDFLIGDGIAMLERMKLQETGYFVATDFMKYIDLLRDSVGRRSIMGVLEILEVLSKNEKDEGKTLISHPRGLQYFEKRFKQNLSQLKKIQMLTKKSIVLAFVAIFVSLISLIFVEDLKNYRIVNLTIIALVFATTFFSMLFTIRGIFDGLKNQKDI
jgi:hypothetical protein